jgi:hypothetical protein
MKVIFVRRLYIYHYTHFALYSNTGPQLPRAVSWVAYIPRLLLRLEPLVAEDRAGIAHTSSQTKRFYSCPFKYQGESLSALGGLICIR